MNTWWKPANRLLIKRYLIHFRPYGPRNRGLVWRAGLSLLAVTLLTLPLPWITMRVIDRIVAENRPGLIWTILAIWAGALALKTLLSIYQGYCCNVYRSRVAFSGKLKLLRHVLSLPTNFFQERQVGYVVCRIRDDIDNLRPLWAESLLQDAKSLVFVTVALVLVFVISWKMALLALITLPLYLVNFALFGDRVRDLTLAVRERIGLVEGKLHDSISAFATVKVFGREQSEAHDYAHLLAGAVRKLFQLELLRKVSSELGSFTQALAPLAVLAYATFLIVRDEMTIGQLVAFITYVSFLFEPVSMLLRKNLDLQKATASLERIFEILDMEPEQGIYPRIIPNQRRARGRLEFRDVTFTYDGDRPALHKINTIIPAAVTIGLAGPSGAGKTTFANLITRILEPQAGTILLDGVDITRIPIHALRRQIGVVAQDSFLFGKSVRENIRYGRTGATDAEVEDAAHRSYADEFIAKLPDGYDTQIGQRGVKLSGGQRARITIARALLKDPAVLILDEATAFLDSHSEALLQEAIAELLQDRTSLVIAHRLSTIEHTDQILVLADGEIRERGTHAELLKVRGLYRLLYEGQYSRPSGVLLLNPNRGEGTDDPATEGGAAALHSG